MAAVDNNGEVYTRIKDRNEEQETREETQSGVAMVTPCRDGNSAEDVIPDTDTGDFIGDVYTPTKDRHDEHEKREKTQAGVAMVTPCRDGNCGENVIPDTYNGDFIGYVYTCSKDRYEEQETREATQSGVAMLRLCRGGNSGEDVIPDTDTGDFIGDGYTPIKDRHEEQETREETQSGVAMVTPSRGGNSGEDVIPDTDTGDFIDSVPNDILQKRVSLVKQYAWIKEEMMQTSAESIADDLYAKDLLSRVACEAICHCPWRRDAVEQLLKKILMGPNDIFDKFLQSLQKQERHIAEKLENTDPTPDEIHVFKLLEKSSRQRGPRPDHKDPRFCLSENDCQTLLFYLNDKSTIDVSNNSLLSRFFFSVREHTNIYVCSMASEGRVRELLNTMKLCSDKIFSSLSEILADMKMEHVTMNLERKRQTAMRKTTEYNTAENEPSTSAFKQLCVDSCTEHHLVTSMQTSAESLRHHTIEELGFDVENVDTGSIVIQLYPISRRCWDRLKENCISGKIKDFISVVYNNGAIQNLLQEGEYRLQFTIYTIPSEQGHLDFTPKALFHLETEHEAPQQGVPVSDVGHHDSPIEDYMDLLCEELEISTALLMLLKEEKIVEDNIKEDIDKQGSRSKKIQYLLNQVDRHGSRGYEVLKQHIKEANQALFNELMTRETSAGVKRWNKNTVGYRGLMKFFSGTAILKVKKNEERTEKEDIDPDAEKRKLEISCPEIINPVYHFNSGDADIERQIREIRLDILKRINRPDYKTPNILLLGKSGSGKSKLIRIVLKALCGYYPNEGMERDVAQSKTLTLTYYRNCGVIPLDIQASEDDDVSFRRNLPNMFKGSAVGKADTPELRELLTLLLAGRICPGTDIRKLEDDQEKYGVGYLQKVAAAPREEWRIHKIFYIQSGRDAAAADVIKSINAITRAPEPKVTDDIFAVISMHDLTVHDRQKSLLAEMLPGRHSDTSRIFRDDYVSAVAKVAKQLSIEDSLEFNLLQCSTGYGIRRDARSDLHTLKFLLKLVLPGPPEPPPIPPKTLA